MQPRGPLMIEHRLIERMIALIKKEIERLQESSTANPVFIDTAVDFIRTYADRTHHGKEEDILFRVLAKKDMSSKDKKIMDELVQEHVFGRKTVGELVKAKEMHFMGDQKALGIVIHKLSVIVDFYPKHIEKEDQIFFPAAMEYLSREEQQEMLQKFLEFDRRMIHEKYKAVVEDMGK